VNANRRTIAGEMGLDSSLNQSRQSLSLARRQYQHGLSSLLNATFHSMICVFLKYFVGGVKYFVGGSSFAAIKEIHVDGFGCYFQIVQWRLLIIPAIIAKRSADEP
jgi:hypothetical protein